MRDPTPCLVADPGACRYVAGDSGKKAVEPPSRACRTWPVIHGMQVLREGGLRVGRDHRLPDTTVQVWTTFVATR